MRLKIKNNSLVAAPLLLLIVASILLVPKESYAGDITNCGAAYGLTAYVVNCVKYNMYLVVYGFISAVSAKVSGLIIILSVIALMLYGYNVVMARSRSLKSDGIILLLKIGGILMFCGISMAPLGGFLPNIFGIIDFFTSTVIGYTYSDAQIQYEASTCPFFTYNDLTTNIWFRVDCVIYKLIGYAPAQPNILTTGILGLLVTSIFSPPIGFSVFLFGLVFLIILLLAISKAVYTYMSAVIGLAILLIFSPFIIPLILFRQTMPMFEKWLRLFIGVILQPIFLSAYVAMLILVAQQAIFTGNYSIYSAITCGKANGAPLGNYIASGGFIQERSFNQSLFDVTLNQDPQQFKDQLGSGANVNTGTAGKLADFKLADPKNPQELYQAGNLNIDMPTNMIRWDLLGNNCGAFTDNDLFQYYFRIIISFFIGLSVAYIFYILLSTVPYLSSEVAGGILSVPNLGGGVNPQQLAQGISQHYSTLRGGGH